MSVSLGDLDGDGDLDAFVGNLVFQGNRVWLNDGAGQFIDSGQSLGNHRSDGVSLGDVDGDGDLDAVVANFDDGNQVWLNDGSGAFTDTGQALGDHPSSAVSLGDLDGDGALDAFVANNDQANRVWLNREGRAQVVQVVADSTAWTSAAFLETIDPGRGLGFSIPGGAAAGQLLSLPWGNVDQVHLVFNTNVDVVQADLQLWGIHGPNGDGGVTQYAFLADDPTDTITPEDDGFRYDASTFTATWTLTGTLSVDKLLLQLSDRVNAGGLALDGETGNPADATLPSGNGNAGGDFTFRFNTLPADASGDGTTDVADLGILGANFNQTGRAGRTGDFTGDGTADVADLGILGANFNQTLPEGQPISLAADGTLSLADRSNDASTLSRTRLDRAHHRSRRYIRASRAPAGLPVRMLSQRDPAPRLHLSPIADELDTIKAL